MCVPTVCQTREKDVLELSRALLLADVCLLRLVRRWCLAVRVVQHVLELAARGNQQEREQESTHEPVTSTQLWSSNASENGFWSRKHLAFACTK